METHDKNEARLKQHFSIKSNISDRKIAIKDVDTESRIVTGFYNSFNYFDDACDVLMVGCSKRSIKARGPSSDSTAKIKHCLNHDLTQLPGKIITLEEKEIDGITGIYFETEMADTTIGNDTLKNYLMKIYDNHSIGYRVIDYQFIERINEKVWNNAVAKLLNPDATEGYSYMWLIKEIQLWEGSTVAFGCNDLTPFLGMKSEDPNVFKMNVMNKLIAMEKALKTGTQSDDMLQLIEVQTLQMKQIFSDLMDKIPSEQEIRLAKEKSKAFDWSAFVKQL